MSGTWAFELKDVSRRYGQRWALSHVSYALPLGGALLLTGHNGSGKTTLLRMLSTLSFPSLGEVKVLGLETRANRYALRNDVALLSHASFVYEDLSPLQNLMVLARLAEIPDPKPRALSLLEEVGLSKRLNHPVRHFSAGMRKRLAIARLLLKAPKVALLDEPFGELDPKGILDMEALIRRLSTAGSTLVLCTHYIEQGKQLTNLRLHLDNGRIAEAKD